MELISIIVLLGVLSVTIAPRIFDDTDVAPNTLQAQLIAVLRNMQIRAMADTREFSGQEYPCFKVIFDNLNNAFGPPSLTYYSTSDPNNPDDAEIAAGLAQTCEDTIETDTSINPEFYFVTAQQMSADSVDLSAVNSDGVEINFIQFDGGGLPSPQTGECLFDTGAGKNGCLVALCAKDCSDTNNARALVCIEPQGYIHAGSCGV